MNSVLSTRKNKRANPIARAPGSIDVNTKLDTSFLQKSQQKKHGRGDCYKTEGTNDIYDVLEGEILMGRKDASMSYKGRTNLCFSSANGLPLPKGDTREELNKLVYAGVAVTGYSQKNDKPREQQGFVASFAGLMTMMNSGTENIYPGDILRVTMPTTDAAKRPAHVKGTPKGKIVFGLAPVTKSNYETVIEAVQSHLLELKDSDKDTVAEVPLSTFYANVMDADGEGNEAEIAYQKLVKFVCDEMESARRFEIGRAMGFARPGHALDVCLG